MKEQVEKQVIQYSEKTLPELLALAIGGDTEAAAEIVARQEAAAAEIESLKVKASKVRTPKTEKTPLDLAADNAYFRTALLAKQFGIEAVNLQVLTVASAYLECGLAQGNLRQAFNRVQQILKAQAVEEQVFPQWILTAANEIPALDENKKLEEEREKVEKIKSIVQKYAEATEQTAKAAQAAKADKAAKAAPAKKGGKK